MPRNVPFVAISSTMRDLADHRRAAVEACQKVGARPLMVERMAESFGAIHAAYDVVDQADIYLGIFGFRYGYVPPGGDRSIVELEYDRAVARAIPRLVYFMSDRHPVQVQDVERGTGALKLSELKDRIQHSNSVTYFGSPDELRIRITNELARQLVTTSRPKKVLMLIPFESSYDQLRNHLRKLLENQGFDVARFDNVKSGATWANAVADAIGAADLIIADVSHANANVMYELGYAHALKKPTILLADAAESSLRLPSDLQGFQILVYDSGQHSDLESLLAHGLRAYVGGAA